MYGQTSNSMRRRNWDNNHACVSPWPFARLPARCLTPMRILVVEDEKKIASLLRRGLREQGFTVDVLENGIEAYEQASSQPYDTMVLDIMLPGRDGLSVLRQLRENGILTPVLLLTARGEVNERIEGLNLGADDYLSKPFSMDEVTARVRALLRRATGEKLSLYKIGDLTMNLVSREIYRGKRKVDLT